MKEADNRNAKSVKKTVTIDENGECRTKYSFVDSLFSKKGLIFEYNKDRLWLPFDRQLPECCTINDCGKFYKILHFVMGDNQLLGYRSNKIKPLTVEKMSEIFGCSDRQTRKFVKKMKDLTVLKEVNINDTKWYAVNPLYALRTKYLSTTTFIIFQDELLSVLPNWAIQKFFMEVPEITDKIVIKK